MSQGTKGRMNYRCPNCFAKEVDVDLLYEKEKDEYYCIKCYFVGSEADILESYERTKKKYKLYMTRLDLIGHLRGNAATKGQCQKYKNGESVEENGNDSG